MSNYKSNKSTKKNSNKLALIFLLRSEGKTIGDVIKSFHKPDGTPIYDYLLVGIDNKTDDNTYEIVSQYCHKDNIFYLDFNDSFCEARNKVIKEAEKLDADWLFMPDGHEFLTPQSVDIVEDVVRLNSDKPRWLAPYVELEPDAHGFRPPFPRPMFWKNNQGFKFERDVHNHLSDIEGYGPNKIKEGCPHAPDITLLHNMPPDRMKWRLKQRADMNVRVLTKNALNGDVRDQFYLGNTYFEMKNYDVALKWYNTALDTVDGNDIDLATQICISICNVYCVLKEWFKIKPYALRGISNRWDRAELYFYLGLVAGQRALNIEDMNGRFLLFKQAIHWHKIASTMEMPLTTYFPQIDMYTWKPLEGLLEGLGNNGYLVEAIEVAKKVKELKPNCPKTDRNIKVLMDCYKNHKEEIDTRDKNTDNFGTMFKDKYKNNPVELLDSTDPFK